MAPEVKFVRDPIHGDIKIADMFIELLDAYEMQRLYNIKQLGFAHLVFPGAHHTRLEHSLGVFHLAWQVADSLGLPDDERRHVVCAGLLHDIGHGPFSHTLESNLEEIFGVDHVDLTEELLLGKYQVFYDFEQSFIDSDSVVEVLNRHGLDVSWVIDIIRGKVGHHSYLSQMLNSSVDVDQLDYLIRDAYYTGVAYGMVDTSRLLQMMRVHDGRLVVDRKGVGSVENMLVARGLMYSSVYFHKTVRIAELMLSRAIALLDDVKPFEFFRMTDAEILVELRKLGEFQREIVTRLKYRELFKQAFAVSFADADDEKVALARSLDGVEQRRAKERELEEALDIPRGHVIIDVPRQELLRAEPRLNLADVGIVEEGGVKQLDAFTPVAGAIRSRVAPDWLVMVVTDERFRDVVAKRAEKILLA